MISSITWPLADDHRASQGPGRTKMRRLVGYHTFHLDKFPAGRVAAIKLATSFIRVSLGRYRRQRRDNPTCDSRILTITGNGTSQSRWSSKAVGIPPPAVFYAASRDGRVFCITGTSKYNPNLAAYITASSLDYSCSL
jgi:hypothetical protein